MTLTGFAFCVLFPRPLRAWEILDTRFDAIEFDEENEDHPGYDLWLKVAITLTVLAGRYPLVESRGCALLWGIFKSRIEIAKFSFLYFFFGRCRTRNTIDEPEAALADHPLKSRFATAKYFFLCIFLGRCRARKWMADAEAETLADAEAEFEAEIEAEFEAEIEAEAAPLAHIKRRIHKLAWPYSHAMLRDLCFQHPVWWPIGVDSQDIYEHLDALPVKAVCYALDNGADPDDLEALMPYVPQEALVLAYGYVRGVQEHDLDRRRRARQWTLKRLRDLGHDVDGLTDSELEQYLNNINSIHMHRLPTGLLHLRRLAGYCGWPYAVERELDRRGNSLYRAFAELRRTWLKP